MAVVGNDEKLGGKLSYLFLDICSVYQKCKENDFKRNCSILVQAILLVWRHGIVIWCRYSRLGTLRIQIEKRIFFMLILDHEVGRARCSMKCPQHFSLGN